MADLKNETLVDRVVLRLKAQPIGDLITEEDLHEIVREAIPKVFNEPTLIKDPDHRGYGDAQMVRKGPSLLHVALKELFAPTAQKMVATGSWRMPASLRPSGRSCSRKGIEKFVEEYRRNYLDMQIRTVLSGAFNRINEERSRTGQSPIFF